MVSPSQFFFHLEICIGITINVKKHSTRKFSTEISPGFLKFHLARIARIPVFSGHAWDNSCGFLLCIYQVIKIIPASKMPGARHFSRICRFLKSTMNNFHYKLNSNSFTLNWSLRYSNLACRILLCVYIKGIPIIITQRP